MHIQKITVFLLGLYIAAAAAPLALPSAQAANVPALIVKALQEKESAQADKAAAQKQLKAQPVKAQPTPKYKLDYIGDTEKYTATYEDTLIHLARKNSIGFLEMRAANPHLDPWMPGEGAEIILPKRHLLPEAPRNGVVINLAEMRLYYFDKAGHAPITFPIGIGREGLQTPLGSTTVTRKAIGPRWRPTERMRTEDPSLPLVVEAGPNNPLGTHAIYLGWPQYAIHGTNRPYGIGRRVSSGCIRMYPESIIQAFDLIEVGAQVTVVEQPLKMGWVDDMLYIEAHAGQELASKMESLGQVPDTILSSDQRATIKFKAGARASDIDWDIVTKAFNARGGYPVPILTDNKRAEAEALIKASELKEAALDLKQDSDSAQAELARSEEALEEKRNQQAATLRKKTYND
jgi:L,D-transpeptidase ErfK/SrfK